MEAKDEDVAMLAILRESMEAAADRLIAEKERARIPKEPRVHLTPGHVYLIIGCTALLLIVIVGAVSK
jgi:hypothetical protein